MKLQVDTEAYPALYEVSARELHSIGFGGPFLVGRSQNANLPLLDLGCSRQQFRISREGGRSRLEALSDKVPTFVNGARVVEGVWLEHGVSIQAGASQFRFLDREDPALVNQAAIAAVAECGTIAPAAATPVEDRTIMIGEGISKERIALEDDIPLKGQMIIGRDAERADICLPHSQVSRVHARIALAGKTAVVADLKSANGTFVNGRLVTEETSIRAGDRIEIGPYSLIFDGQSLSAQSRHNNVELVCRNLRRAVKQPATGRDLTLLDDVSLVVEPREFVCILGPSGSGKSTLLSALSARVPADAGTVLLNGEDLYQNFEALKQGISVVPQRDALHELLTVGHALEYVAKLRLPPDTSQAEIKAAVNGMLATVALQARKDTRISSLSGGELKRASLACEIISQPSVIFLDEVTSGLDEQTDREIMELFRSLADAGKTILCVTHSLANVERNCHILVVLASGGKLAYVGPPRDALQFFEVERLGDIYLKLASKPGNEWRDAFRRHELHATYVAERLPRDGAPQHPSRGADASACGNRSGVFKQQAKVLVARYLETQLADRRTLTIMVSQCIFIGLLLGILFGDIGAMSNLAGQASCTANVLFLMSTSCFWFGCNNAAKELVKERVIYTRERDVNLLFTSYFVSKIAVLGAFSLFQTTLLLAIVKLMTDAPGAFAGQWFVLGTLALTGTGVGLLISALSKSEDMAATIVPLVLIPQIILAGVVAPVKGLCRFLATFVSEYWGYSTLVANLPTDLRTYLGAEDWSATRCFVMLLLHLLIAVGATIAILASSTARSHDGPFYIWTAAKSRLQQLQR